MITVGKWRWPLVVGMTFVVAGALVWRGIVRLRYDGQAMLTYSGNVKNIDAELRMFRASHGSKQITFEKVPSQPLQIVLRAQGPWPDPVVQHLTAEAQSDLNQSLVKEREELQKDMAALQTKVVDLETRTNQIIQDRAAVLAGPRRGTPRAELVSKIEELKARRRSLIERYPTHTDIPLLAKKIQGLLDQMQRKPAPLAEKITEFDRQINETKLRRDHFSRLLQEMSKEESNLKPAWKLSQPIQKPKWPSRVEGWPIGAGAVVGIFVLGFVVLKGKAKVVSSGAANGLWKPEPVATPVDLQVVSPEPSAEVAEIPEPDLPSDPMTEKAAALYSKWVDVCKTLYEPAKEPPQGVLDQVTPLFQESSDYLPEGHDVMARYLSRTVAPGNLPAHVARTVLMTLTGAQEAGVSPEHRLAMGLAALFHDLAVVPRPAAQQDNVGSEVGRLSATVLRRIPGLQPALLSMVEDILIGMDEFKLETWQNGATGNHLEPLSKVLREIDRFEKIMQRQKSRLERRVANQ